MTYYLNPEAVEAIVSLVKQTAKGSVLVLDYFSIDLVMGRILPRIHRYLRLYGEPLLYGIGSKSDEAPAAQWAVAHGLKLRDWLPGGPKGARWGGVLSVEVVLRLRLLTTRERTLRLRVRLPLQA